MNFTTTDNHTLLQNTDVMYFMEEDYEEYEAMNVLDDAAIEANDIDSLMEQFLEYEEVHGSNGIEKELLDFLTPATSPRDDTTSLPESPLVIDTDEKTIESNETSPKHCGGLTPPLTPVKTNEKSETSESYPTVEIYDKEMTTFDCDVAEEVVNCTEEIVCVVEQPAEVVPEKKKQIPKQYRSKRQRSKSPSRVKHIKRKRESKATTERKRRHRIRRSSLESISSDEENWKDKPRHNNNVDYKKAVNNRPLHEEYEDKFGRFHSESCDCSTCFHRVERPDHDYGQVETNDSLGELHNRLTELANPVPYDIERKRKVNFLIRPEERINSKNERRNMYVGRIPESTTKEDLLTKFERYGPIEKVTLHFRDRCDSYAFVVFYYPEDAASAIEGGTSDKSCAELDLCFGGRRKFVGGSYVDFDGNVSYLEENIPTVKLNKQADVSSELDFDSLLDFARKQQKSDR